MKRPIAVCLVSIFALLTAACSGSNPGGALPRNGAATGTDSATKTSIVIRVPKHPKRRAHYIGTTTQSMSIAVSPASGCSSCSPAINLDAGLTSGSPDCVDGAAATTCSLSLVLSPGSYTGTIVTYDGPLSVTHLPTGTVLSKDQSFPMTIVQGKANVPVISLYGVPSGIRFFSLSNNLGIVTNVGELPNSLGFFIAGPASQARFSVYATDPDGNLILGPGAPTFSVATTGSFSASVSGSTGRLVAPPSISLPLATITFTASSPACVSSASCMWTESLGFDTLLAVADSSNDDVVISTTNINTSSPIFATVRTGVSSPGDVKFDAVGNLFVANSAGNTVTEYAPPYTGAPIATISNGINGPTQLAFAPNGTLAVVNTIGGNVTVYAPPFASSSPTTIPAAALSETFDASGSLWLGTPSSGVRRYASPFTTASTTASSGVSSPEGIAFDSSGNLYVANHGNNTIEAFSSSALSGAPTATATMAGVSSLTVEFGFIVACGTGMANLYGSSLTSPLSDQAGTTPCHSAWDRFYGLWLTIPDEGYLLDFVYPPGIGGETEQNAGLSQPQAIAAFP
jgi:hypothetical protein